MCFGGGGPDPAEEARKAEQKRQGSIRQGMGGIDAAFGQFDDNFFNQRRDAYMNYALPQLNDQYASARKNLIYALSRNGNLQSTAGAERMGALKKQYDAQSLAVKSQADQIANQTRSDVENSRSDIVSQLEASADPGAASTAALNRARLLTAAPAFSPLGALFQNVTAGLAASAPAGGYAPVVKSLFTGGSSGTGSQTIVS